GEGGGEGRGPGGGAVDRPGRGRAGVLAARLRTAAGGGGAARWWPGAGGGPQPDQRGRGAWACRSARPAAGQGRGDSADRTRRGLSGGAAGLGSPAETSAPPRGAEVRRA